MPPKSKFTEEQIAYALKQTEAGVPVAEVCRKYGVSEQTYYVWRKKYGGLAPSEAGQRSRSSQRPLVRSSSVGHSGAVFLRFVREHLGPSLRAGDVVVMGNQGAHHATRVR
jgi:hypothetical protein